MQVRQFYTPGLAIYSYLIFDDKTKRGAVIDPTRQVEAIVAKAKEEKVAITDILETHVHADFVSGAHDLKAALGGKAKIHCSGMGGAEWTPKYADSVVKDKDKVSLGNVYLEAIHTPGHTPEHMVWLAYDTSRDSAHPCILFSGDLLFVGSVGRPDLLGKNIEEGLSKQLYKSLFDVLKGLPDYLEVYPSHGSESLCGKGITGREISTLGYERLANPFLQHHEYPEWHNELMKGMPQIPAYFKRMKKVNVTGLEHNQGDQMPPTLSYEQYSEIKDQCQVIDVRGADIFAGKHLKGSLNIPNAPHFLTWVGSLVSPDKPLIIVVENPSDAVSVVNSLKLIGYDKVKGVVAISQWTQKDFDSFPLIKPQELAQNMKKYFILDVRRQDEWDSGHIEGAHRIELTEVPKSLDKIPKGVPVAVICRSGARASIVASLLQKQGGYQPGSVHGGMMAWDKYQENKT